MTGGFPSQSVSNVENVSIWWRHHVKKISAYGMICVNLSSLRSPYNVSHMVHELMHSVCLWSMSYHMPCGTQSYIWFLFFVLSLFVRKPEYYFHFASFPYTELALVWNRLKLFVEIIINIITISLLFHHHNPHYDLQKSIFKPYHSSYTKAFSAYLMWYTAWHSQSARYVSIYILIFRHILTS